ncbi:MAG: hypothetical protein CL529_08460 [Aequorivita sp.]|nr:hypothetical protein [Aequorivita sp.]|tara:strand:- start:33939 stop:34586 length:648 start_codon:yes stop_codon:yes gene_type:complete
MVEKKVIKSFSKILLSLILICFINACTDNDTYQEKVDKINQEYKEDKKEIITDIVVERIEHKSKSEKSVEKLNELEKNYEEKLNELNDLFKGQEVIAPFKIEKITDVELAGYEMQVELNIKNRTVFNVIVNKVSGWLFEVLILALFVIVLGFFVNYSQPFALIRVLLSHWIIIIIFFAIGIFFSPAEYFGLIASDLENDTEKIIDLNFQKSENNI